MYWYCEGKFDAVFHFGLKGLNQESTWEFSSWNPSRKDSNNSAALSILSAYSPIIQIIEALRMVKNQSLHREASAPLVLFQKMT